MRTEQPRADAGKSEMWSANRKARCAGREAKHLNAKRPKYVICIPLFDVCCLLQSFSFVLSMYSPCRVLRALSNPQVCNPEHVVERMMGSLARQVTSSKTVSTVCG